jgi:phage shock protein A
MGEQNMHHDFLYRCRMRAQDARLIAVSIPSPQQLAAHLARSASDMELLLDGADVLKDEIRNLRLKIAELERDKKQLQATSTKAFDVASKHRRAASMISNKHEALAEKLLKSHTMINELRYALDEAIRLLEAKHGTAKV